MKTRKPVKKKAAIIHFDDLPEMVTVEEMRDFLRVSRNAAYELVKTGAVRSVKFGKLIRIPKTALVEGSR